MDWPEWWDWEIELSSHVLKRMIDRRFNEADLRAMLADATHYRAAIEDGRWIIETSIEDRRWEIIVEPDIAERRLVVVTAFCKA